MQHAIDFQKLEKEQDQTGLPLPEVELPKDWVIRTKAPDGFAAERWDGLLVIASCAIEQDGKPWIHVSVSRKTRLPDYKELCEIKNLFIGPDAKAIHIFPRKHDHVNIFKYCLHLWSCLDGDPLPEFSRGLGTI